MAPSKTLQHPLPFLQPLTIAACSHWHLSTTAVDLKLRPMVFPPPPVLVPQHFSLVPFQPESLGLPLKPLPSIRHDLSALSWLHRSFTQILTVPAGPSSLLTRQFFFFFKFTFIYVRWSFVCMHVCVTVSEHLKLELQTGMSCHAGAGN